MPHEVFAYLLDTGLVKVDTAAVAFFGRHFRNLGVEWAVKHPATENHSPLGIYGDDARYTLEGDKLIAVFFDFLLHRRPTGFGSRFLLFFMRCSKSLGHRTLQPLWRVLMMSFNIIFGGVGGFQGAVCEYRGDWKWHREIYLFRTGWRNRHVCHQCPVESVFSSRPSTAQPAFPLTDLFGEWANNIYNLDEFFHHVLPRTIFFMF